MMPAGSSALTSSRLNSLRLSAVVDRLALNVGTASKDDDEEFISLCISLAKSIDYAVVYNEVPDKAKELPNLLKKLCQRKALLLQAAIMVLMISVKSACKTEWFSNEDSRELLSIADEVASSFSSVDKNPEMNNSLQNISTITARYFPHLKMGQMLSFVEVKPGYGTYLTDFHIPKNAKLSGEQKVRLLVAQTDNMETSSCLTNPPQANFFINGKGVKGRTSVFLEGGPLLPTIVTCMLMFGINNILQVVGQFPGNYIIVVAYMSVISNLDSAALQDYVQPEVTVQDQDLELVEGPSWISLNCPISFKRIKTPVKGHLCKHIQCFDFDNFVDINSRRPSWRCPTCNQCVSYVDIRLDQYMAKVLKEVEEDVSEVIVSADGSWKSTEGGHEYSDPPRSIMPSCQQEMPAHCPNALLDLMDLTEGDADMDEPGLIDMHDMKPNLAVISNHFEAENAMATPENNNPNIVSQNGDGHTEADFWSQMFLSTYPSEGPGPRPQLQNLQSQISQLQNSLTSNEYGTNPPVTGTSVEVAVQNLPVQFPTSVPRHSLLSHSRPSDTLPMGGGLSTNLRTLERQIQNSRSHSSSLQLPQMNSSHFNPVRLFSMNSSILPQFQSQSQHHQTNSLISSLPSQSTITPAPLLSSRTSPHPIPPPHLRVPHAMSQHPYLNRSSTQSPQNNHIPASQNHNLIPQQKIRLAQRPPHLATGRQYSSAHPIPNHQNRATSSVPLPGEGSRTLARERGANIPNEENNWRPTSRMRGALRGQAYSAALQQFIFQPAQPVQASSPLSLPLPLPLIGSVDLIAANNRIAREFPSPQGASSSSTASTVVSDVSALVTEPTSAPQ